ncbi:hypothetical protein Q9L42_014510 [Methylomarinum sp. Ch1-1]|uniref:DoxX family protein n=1 Tax=Methylomarinum roseum TaxID=3067653 RepID=A0AAU7NRI2_9GAMM|nr:hypothetical protein [Methylomarinum sp. Ch1-1]MDP4520464.1 hypothetical protein [Methylomarinum sp. Ch1-1]
MKRPSHLQWSLLFMRASIFVVMLMWTLDKFINPGHAAKVYEKFYWLTDLNVPLMAVIGTVELIILVGFLLGLYKRFSYGAVLVFHAISTVSSFQQYLAPFEGPNLLFFAAWPMLAGCLMLYLLRDEDNFMTVKR